MDDSDKAGTDFASKAPLVYAAYEQTAFRDRFMPASLGINYTPCQAADAILATRDGPAIRKRGWKKRGKEEKGLSVKDKERKKEYRR